MPRTVHVIARVRAKPGKEDALRTVLEALVPPSRRELACYQYDLVQNDADPREFCFVQRWETNEAADRHAASEHVRRASEQMAELVEAAPDIRRFHHV
jgi:quinol monooxygenase YgiN